MTKTQINPKLIFGVDGQPAIRELDACNLTDIVAKGLWSGPARLHLVPHIHAPVTDFLVRRIVGGRHFIVDLTLPYGRVVHDTCWIRRRQCCYQPRLDRRTIL